MTKAKAKDVVSAGAPSSSQTLHCRDIQQEQTKSFDMFECLHGISDLVNTRQVHEHIEVPQCAVTIDDICKLYHPSKESSASPMERWATMQTRDESFPLLAKVTMQAVETDFESLKSSSIWTAAARHFAIDVDAIDKIIATSGDVLAKDTRVEDDTGGHTYTGNLSSRAKASKSCGSKRSGQVAKAPKARRRQRSIALSIPSQPESG